MTGSNEEGIAYHASSILRQTTREQHLCRALFARLAAAARAAVSSTRLAAKLRAAAPCAAAAARHVSRTTTL